LAAHCEKTIGHRAKLWQKALQPAFVSVFSRTVPTRALHAASAFASLMRGTYIAHLEKGIAAMHDDLSSFLRRTGFTRRDFVVTTLATGFALAVQPVSADTITTDSQGLEAGEAKIRTADGEMPAYRAMPAAGGPFPVILVVQEIFGVHEHIKDLCRRLAKSGYLAVAPELYARQGDVSKISDIREVISKVVSKVPDAQVLSDLDATVAWAKATGRGNTAKLGITGFCWGGRIVWLYAAHNPNLKAGVAWYGRLVGDKDELRPKNPVDLAGTLGAPVLGLYGGADTGIPADSIEKMRGALQEAKHPSEIIVYPDTPHGFNADYRPSYRKQQAEDGWKRMLEWFKKNGAA
jgi:carboxymethylenebutenolidase